VRLLFNEVYGGVQWRKKRSLKDLSDWNLFVVDSSNGSAPRPYSFHTKLVFSNKTPNILTGNCVHTKTKPHFRNGFV
jgi:hypothetical protein